ncbi:MAG: hypothetical protein HOQ05_05685 [Corynebacteriales bacterium]|nr:hypothetical protein [Mycobacteriales bacterium]
MENSRGIASWLGILFQGAAYGLKFGYDAYNLGHTDLAGLKPKDEDGEKDVLRRQGVFTNPLVTLLAIGFAGDPDFFERKHTFDSEEERQAYNKVRKLAKNMDLQRLTAELNNLGVAAPRVNEVWESHVIGPEVVAHIAAIINRAPTTLGSHHPMLKHINETLGTSRRKLGAAFTALQAGLDSMANGGPITEKGIAALLAKVAVQLQETYDDALLAARAISGDDIAIADYRRKYGDSAPVETLTVQNWNTVQPPAHAPESIKNRQWGSQESSVVDDSMREISAEIAAPSADAGKRPELAVVAVAADVDVPDLEAVQAPTVDPTLAPVATSEPTVSGAEQPDQLPSAQAETSAPDVVVPEVQESSAAPESSEAVAVPAAETPEALSTAVEEPTPEPLAASVGEPAAQAETIPDELTTASASDSTSEQQVADESLARTDSEREAALIDVEPESARPHQKLEPVKPEPVSQDAEVEPERDNPDPAPVGLETLAAQAQPDAPSLAVEGEEELAEPDALAQAKKLRPEEAPAGGGGDGAGATGTSEQRHDERQGTDKGGVSIAANTKNGNGSQTQESNGSSSAMQSGASSDSDAQQPVNLSRKAAELASLNAVSAVTPADGPSLSEVVALLPDADQRKPLTAAQESALIRPEQAPVKKSAQQQFLDAGLGAATTSGTVEATDKKPAVSEAAKVANTAVEEAARYARATEIQAAALEAQQTRRVQPAAGELVSDEGSVPAVVVGTSEQRPEALMPHQLVDTSETPGPVAAGQDSVVSPAGEVAAPAVAQTNPGQLNETDQASAKHADVSGVVAAEGAPQSAAELSAQPGVLPPGVVEPNADPAVENAAQLAGVEKAPGQEPPQGSVPAAEQPIDLTVTTGAQPTGSAPAVIPTNGAAGPAVAGDAHAVPDRSTVATAKKVSLEIGDITVEVPPVVGRQVPQSGFHDPARLKDDVQRNTHVQSAELNPRVVAWGYYVAATQDVRVPVPPESKVTSESRKKELFNTGMNLIGPTLLALTDKKVDQEIQDESNSETSFTALLKSVDALISDAREREDKEALGQLLPFRKQLDELGDPANEVIADALIEAARTQAYEEKKRSVQAAQMTSGAPSGAAVRPGVRVASAR